MTDRFKKVDSDLIVEYLGIGTYYNIEEIDNCIEPIHHKVACIKYRDTNTNDVILMPILTFLNYFQPYDTPIKNVVSVFNNILNAEDERHQKDIHTLHSGESETDPEGSPTGVQE